MKNLLSYNDFILFEQEYHLYEMEFSSKEEYMKYRANHKMRKSTKVTIAGTEKSVKKLDKIANQVGKDTDFKGKLNYHSQFSKDGKSLSATLSKELDLPIDDESGGSKAFDFDNNAVYDIKTGKTILPDALSGKYDFNELKDKLKSHFEKNKDDDKDDDKQVDDKEKLVSSNGESVSDDEHIDKMAKFYKLKPEQTEAIKQSAKEVQPMHNNSVRLQTAWEELIKKRNNAKSEEEREKLQSQVVELTRKKNAVDQQIQNKMKELKDKTNMDKVGHILFKTEN